VHRDENGLFQAPAQLGVGLGGEGSGIGVDVAQRGG